MLLCARYGGAGGGAVSGAATGAAFSLADLSSGYLCGAYAFGGLMAGLFSPLGKLGCALSFLLSNAVMTLGFGRQGVLAASLIESAAGGAVFLLLPKELGALITPVFRSEENASLMPSPAATATMPKGLCGFDTFGVNFSRIWFSLCCKVIFSIFFSRSIFSFYKKIIHRHNFWS